MRVMPPSTMYRRTVPGLRPSACAAAVSALAAPFPAWADDSQQWLQVHARVDLSKVLVLQQEATARFSDERRGLYEIESAALIGYRLPNKVSLWAGYVHNPSYAAGAFTGVERRVREQVTIDDFARIGRVSLSARVRMEQRWRDGVAGTGWRTRPYLELAVPLGGKSAPTLSLTQEAFINMNTTPFQTRTGLERIRTGVALSFPLDRALKLEAGYLNQHHFVITGPDKGDHILTISVQLSL